MKDNFKHLSMPRVKIVGLTNSKSSAFESASEFTLSGSEKDEFVPQGKEINSKHLNVVRVQKQKTDYDYYHVDREHEKCCSDVGNNKHNKEIEKTPLGRKSTFQGN